MGTEDPINKGCIVLSLKGDVCSCVTNVLNIYLNLINKFVLIFYFCDIYLITYYLSFDIFFFICIYILIKYIYKFILCSSSYIKERSRIKERSLSIKDCGTLLMISHTIKLSSWRKSTTDRASNKRRRIHYFSLTALEEESEVFNHVICIVCQSEETPLFNVEWLDSGVANIIANN